MMTFIIKGAADCAIRKCGIKFPLNYCLFDEDEMMMTMLMMFPLSFYRHILHHRHRHRLEKKTYIL